MFAGLRALMVFMGLAVLVGCGAQPKASLKTDGFQELINAERSQNGLSPVTKSYQLEKAAQLHANDMASRGYLSHTSPEGGTASQRALAQGYSFCFLAENIARDQLTQTEVFKSWMNSKGHRENILSKSATQFGFASAPGNYWVLLLGRPGC
ncbi:MAG: CAP domain-containing protein [Marinosulfonomonas sp.]